MKCSQFSRIAETVVCAVAKPDWKKNTTRKNYNCPRDRPSLGIHEYPIKKNSPLKHLKHWEVEGGPLMRPPKTPKDALRDVNFPSFIFLPSLRTVDGTGYSGYLQQPSTVLPSSVLPSSVLPSSVLLNVVLWTLAKTLPKNATFKSSSFHINIYNILHSEKYIFVSFRYI